MRVAAILGVMVVLFPHLSVASHAVHPFENGFVIAVQESGKSVGDDGEEEILTVTVGAPGANEEEGFKSILVQFIPVRESPGQWVGVSWDFREVKYAPGAPEEILPPPFDVLSGEELEVVSIIVLYEDGSSRMYFRDETGRPAVTQVAEKMRGAYPQQ